VLKKLFCLHCTAPKQEREANTTQPTFQLSPRPNSLNLFLPTFAGIRAKLKKPCRNFFLRQGCDFKRLKGFIYAIPGGVIIITQMIMAIIMDTTK